MKTLITTLLLTVSSLVNADLCKENTVMFGGWSKHFISNKFGDKPWNEDHEVLGLSCDTWSIVSFDNSYGKEAYGIGKDLFKRDYKGFDVSLYTAAWTGYGDVPVNLEGVIPVVSPKVQYSYKNFKATSLLNPVVAVIYLEYIF